MYLLSVLRENFEHMLVEPFQLVAYREPEVLKLLGDEGICLLALLVNPLGRPDCGCFTACGSHCSAAGSRLRGYMRRETDWKEARSRVPCYHNRTPRR